MAREIIGERLKKLLHDKKISQEKFAEMVGDIKRETINQICNNKYKHTPSKKTLNNICNALDNLGYSGDVQGYLFGEIEYEDLNPYKNFWDFFNKSIDKFSTHALVDNMLRESGIVTPTEDKKYMRLSAEGDNDSMFIDSPVYIDMNEAEYSVFTAYLSEQIRIACDNYVKITAARKVYGFDDLDDDATFE